MNKNSDLNISLIVISGVAALTFLLFYLVVLTGIRRPSGKDDIRILNIPLGSNMSQVADSLVSIGVVNSAREVGTAGKMLGAETLIKAGRYRINQGARLYEIFNLITSGEVEPVVVTIREGWNSRLIARELSEKLDIDVIRFLSLLSDSVLIAEIGLATHHLEGYLFPETYHFSYDMTEASMIKWMVALFLEKIGDEERARAREMNMTLNEVITLASIIEGEAVHDTERPIVSSVYHNRIKQNMRLQADPTIQFLLPDGPRRLTSKDLFIKSPYNTYRHSGLPPGPIGSPGLASIRASLWPEETDYIYFVATGDGYHTFSETLEQHNEAKKKLRRLRAEYDREKLDSTR